ncbi:MAG TPA: PP2C family serine/threonine-protein phosphatase [Polyangiaceae bacterium]|jgi:protein phosphatase|nr:PP2C family serine/threonine-protein phosphatase [Polyangiaceae bacterium]
MSSTDKTGPPPKPDPATEPPETARAPAAAATGGGATSSPLRRAAHALTDLGRKRTSNEDAFFVDDALGLYVVADGMGGHAAGEVASREAVDTLYGMVKRGLGGLPKLTKPVSERDSRDACRLMESAVQAATYFVFSIAEIDRAKSGMGTTISALLILGDYAITAQVGDSRIYCVTRGVVEQLTEDHTLIAWQLKNGLITPQEAARSPHKNVITRAVGNREYVQVDTRCVPLAPGMRFLLCSDGLHGYLRDEDIPNIVAMGGPEAVKRFIDLANGRGGKDNITAVLVEID